MKWVHQIVTPANSVDLEGQVMLNQEKWPTLIDISGRIANPDGTSTLLPISGEGTRVEAVTLRVDYDAVIMMNTVGDPEHLNPIKY